MDHSQECGCDHDHDHNRMDLRTRWLFSALTVGVILVLLRPLAVELMFVRANAYASYARHDDVIRICKKIVFIDWYDPRAWTALGFSFIDDGRPQSAIPAFDKAVEIDPRNKAAALFELGRAYFLKRNFAEAARYFRLVQSAVFQAGALSDPEVLKYRHTASGFQSTYDMGTLLGVLMASYKLSQDNPQAAEVQKEYEIYKSKNKIIFF